MGAPVSHQILKYDINAFGYIYNSADAAAEVRGDKDDLEKTYFFEYIVYRAKAEAEQEFDITKAEILAGIADD